MVPNKHPVSVLSHIAHEIAEVYCGLLRTRSLICLCRSPATHMTSGPSRQLFQRNLTGRPAPSIEQAPVCLDKI